MTERPSGRLYAAVTKYWPRIAAGLVSGDAAPTLPDRDSEVTGVSITVGDTLVLPGSSIQGVATVSGSSSANATWRSLDPGVATVDAFGTITGVAPGRASITASAGGRADTVEIGVAVAFRSITAGRSHTCGLDVDGGVWCWGSGSSGQIGDAFPGTKVRYPVSVALEGTATTLASGPSHNCVLVTAGAAHAGDGTGSGVNLGTERSSSVRNLWRSLVACRSAS